MDTHWSQPADGFEADSIGYCTPHEHLRRSRERYSAVVRAGALILWRADLSGAMTAVTGWETLTGRPDHEALGRGWLERFHPDDRTLLDFRGREYGDTVQAECRVLDSQGRWRWVRGRGVLIPDSGPFPAEWVGTLEDMHEERLALERARFLAERDALTGLGNRRMMYEHIARLRGRRVPAAVVLLDVDRFKTVNDMHGHQVGDRVLVLLAQTLIACAPDAAGCFRMGGDEFCVVVDGLDAAQELCARLNLACAEGLSLGELRNYTGFSAGIAAADWSEPDPASTVLRRADLALYHAKGRDGAAVLYEPAMQAESDARQLLLKAMSGAYRNDEFFLEYQPIVRLDDSAVVSFEVLLRWQNPLHGRIDPSTFVRLAEQNGMIGELGRWVLDRACADLAATGQTQRLNINVSARQLADVGFADAALAIAQGYGIDPARITLELTESLSSTAVVEGAEVEQLRRHGFHLVLDDFGTEYAVLSHVSSGRFDGVKLSRDFISQCCGCDRARLVLRHMVNLCDDLGLSVVAEGIETDAELEVMRDAGVGLAQGYYFDRPGRLADLAQRLSVAA